MLSKGLRLAARTGVTPFAWSQAAEPAGAFAAPAAEPLPAPAEPAAETQARLAALERDAFATAYAQGERAGLEAGAKRADAMLRRVAETLRELEELRRSMIRQTEQQVVQLGLAIAQRILRKEIAVDQDLMCAMARVALDRLGDAAPATVRLHPDDHAAVLAIHGAGWGGTHVTILADPGVSRGGCMVESPFGFIDASVEAQFRVLEQALVADDRADSRVTANRAA
jgi:flagellar assembly protein FliH